MDNQLSEDQVEKSIPTAAYDFAITELNLPLNTISLLGNGGFATVGELMQRLKGDRESLLAVNGIGPKTLASIELAVSEFDPAKKTRTYPEPIPSFGDHYKTAPQAGVTSDPAIEELIEAEQKEEQAAGETKAKDKKDKKKKDKKKKDKKMATMKSKKKNPDNTKKDNKKDKNKKKDKKKSKK